MPMAAGSRPACSEAGLRRLQHRWRPVAVLNRIFLHLHLQAPAIGIHHGVPLAAFDLRAGVAAARTARLGGLDALRVNDRAARAGVTAGSFAITHNQMMMQAFPGSVVTEAHEPAAGRLVRREVLGQHAPGDAAAQDEEDGVHQFAHVPRPLPAGFGWRRQQRNECLPFGIGQIAGIAQVVAVVLSSGFGGQRRPLN